MPAVLVALIPAIALGVAPAHAQGVDAAHATRVTDDAIVRHMEVHYGDLDLTTASGRHQLDLRLKRSAAIVCGRDDSDHLLVASGSARDCYNTALVHARTALADAVSKSRLASRQ